VIVAELQAGRSVGGFATAIQLGDGDPLDGVVLADYLWTVSESHLENFEHLGDLTPATLRNVDAALSVALELS
jgi:mRNA-degrading endonuclease toxin of MazEF toxin-antitoxin module